MGSVSYICTCAISWSYFLFILALYLFGSDFCGLCSLLPQLQSQISSNFIARDELVDTTSIIILDKELLATSMIVQPSCYCKFYQPLSYLLIAWKWLL